MTKSVSWLADLESQVAAAVSQLQALRKENRQVKSKLKRLQQELSQLRAEGGGSEGWSQAQRQVRRRLGKLADDLEKLL